MSIRAISWAWTQQVKSSQKLVLMALADSADDFGEARVSQSFLAWKTEYSERFVRKAITELEEAGLMTRVRTTRRDGTRGVDGLVLHLEKASSKAAWGGLSEVRRQLREQVSQRGLPAGEDFGPDLVAEQPEGIAPSQSHRNNVPVDEAPPVDNSVSPSGNHRNNVPVEGSYRNTVPVLPERRAGSDPRGLSTTRAPVFYPSSSSVPEDGPVDDDRPMTMIEDHPQQPTPASRPSQHRGVNVARLRMEHGAAVGSWAEAVWVAVVDLVLSRARGAVSRPQAFVSRAIENDHGVMIEAAEAVGQLEDVFRATAQPGPGQVAQPVVPAARAAVSTRRVSCPVHYTDHLESHECGGCRADRLAQRSEEG